MKYVLSFLLTTALMLSALAAIPMHALAAGKGDFNNDGTINTADAREDLRITLQGGTPTQQQIWWCDYDQDDALNTTDVRLLLKRMLKGYNSIDYINIESTDCWGEKSIALLGDSISFGTGCSDPISENSYAGIVKNAINAANGSLNYGFMPAYSKNWEPIESEEVCGWPTMTGGPGVVGNPEGWAEEDNGNYLMTCALTAYKQWASLTYTLRSNYDYQYVCVYYQTGPSRGQFVVANNEPTEEGYLGYDQVEVDATQAKVYDCENTIEETKRTGFFKVSDFPNGISVNIVSNDNQPVTITGLGFYNDISGKYVTFNKYCRGGSMLTPLSDKVLDQATSAGTLILALGYNDAFWGHLSGYTAEQFTNRIDYLIEAINNNGTQLIVNDYFWSNFNRLDAYLNWDASIQADINYKRDFFRSELRRLARETGGIYIDQEAYHGADVIMPYVEAFEGDGSHPSDEGHALLAKAVLEALGL